MKAGDWSDNKTTQLVGKILRAGVILAAGIIFLGGALYLIGHGGEIADYGNFRGEPIELKGLSGIVRGITNLQSRALIQFGLLLLIATPVARVGFSVYGFWRERDWTYVAITLAVLAMLFFSFIRGIA